MDKGKGHIVAWKIENEEQLQKIIELEQRLAKEGVEFDAGATNGHREWFLDINHQGIRVDEDVGGKMTYGIKFDAPVKVTEEIGEAFIDLGYNISVEMDRAMWTIGKNNQKIDLTSKEYDQEKAELLP